MSSEEAQNPDNTPKEEVIPPKPDSKEVAKKEETKQAKSKKKSKLKDLKLKVYAYKNEDGKEVKLFLPRYFTEEARYTSEIEQQTDQFNAQSFLLGLDDFKSQGSVTGYVTYSGPKRRYTIKVLGVAERAVLQGRGDWKVTYKHAFLERGLEWTGKIKDSEFIRQAMTTPGGKANLTIRFEKDPPFHGKKKAIAKSLRRDENRLRALPYRMKLSHAKQGIKPVVKHLEEAKQLQAELSKANLPDTKHVLQFLQEKIREFETQKKEQADQRQEQQTR